MLRARNLAGLRCCLVILVQGLVSQACKIYLYCRVRPDPRSFRRVPDETTQDALRKDTVYFSDSRKQGAVF